MLITDFFGKASIDTNYAIATTVKTTRTAGVTVLEAFDLSKFSDDTPVFFITYKKITDPVTSEVTISDLVSYKALVNTGANTLTNLTVAPGYTDIGNDVGDFVECIPTAYWENSLIDGISVSIDPDGTLKAGAVDNAAVLASDVVTTVKILDANITTAKIAAKAATLVKINGGSTAGALVTDTSGNVSPWSSAAFNADQANINGLAGVTTNIATFPAFTVHTGAVRIDVVFNAVYCTTTNYTYFHLYDGASVVGEICHTSFNGTRSCSGSQIFTGISPGSHSFSVRGFNPSAGWQLVQFSTMSGIITEV